MNTIDITARLTRLNKTVEQTISRRNREAKATTAALLDRKRRDWEECCERAPDHARLIGELSAGFGKLAYVRVTVGHDVVLDSDRYADG